MLYKWLVFSLQACKGASALFAVGKEGRPSALSHAWNLALTFRLAPSPRSLFLVPMTADHMPTRSGPCSLVWAHNLSVSLIPACREETNPVSCSPAKFKQATFKASPTDCSRRWACLGAQLPETGKLGKNLLLMLWHEGMSDPQLSCPHTTST